jgi:RNA recognition motif-containing protein
MTTKILMQNLPSDVTIEEIEEFFAQYGESVQVEFEKAGNPNKVTAIVSMDIDADIARIAAEHRQGLIWTDSKGNNRQIEFYVPLFFN